MMILVKIDALMSCSSKGLRKADADGAKLAAVFEILIQASFNIGDLGKLYCRYINIRLSATYLFLSKKLKY
jgi:hypothetical protein